MVLEIRIRNFFSIKDEVVLDFRAAKMNTQATKALENNIFDFDKTQVLKTVVLYGANASGKSSIIKAIRFWYLYLIGITKIQYAILNLSYLSLVKKNPALILFAL